MVKDGVDFNFMCLYFNFNGKITPLKEKGGIDIFNYNLKEVSVYFKTRGGVSFIYNMFGWRERKRKKKKLQNPMYELDCNFPLFLLLKSLFNTQIVTLHVAFAFRNQQTIQISFPIL
jgi:hypothetical protein